MNTQNFDTSTPENHPETDQCRCGAAEAGRPSLTRSIRLVSRLMRAEMRKTLGASGAPTRGEVKTAARAIEDRAAGAVSAEDLAITLATLDRIADAFGGRDALPFHPHGRRGPRGHRGFGVHSGFGGHRGFDGHRGHPRRGGFDAL